MNETRTEKSKQSRALKIRTPVVVILLTVVGIDYYSTTERVLGLFCEQSRTAAGAKSEADVCVIPSKAKYVEKQHVFVVQDK